MLTPENGFAYDFGSSLISLDEKTSIFMLRNE